MSIRTLESGQTYSFLSNRRTFYLPTKSAEGDIDPTIAQNTANLLAEKYQSVILEPVVVYWKSMPDVKSVGMLKLTIFCHMNEALAEANQIVAEACHNAGQQSIVYERNGTLIVERITSNQEK